MSIDRRILRRIAVVLLVCAVCFGAAGCRRAADPQAYLLPIEAQTPAVTAAPDETPAPRQTAQPTAAPAEATAAPEVTAAPEATAAPADANEPQGGEEPEKAKKYAAGYVRVISATQSGWLPLPEKEDMVFPLRQITADGQETLNVIHLTPTGVYMESADCDNQDCVKQGEVTLENMHDRVMGNAIICLPHQVYLELYSTEELLAAAAQEEAP